MLEINLPNLTKIYIVKWEISLSNRIYNIFHPLSLDFRTLKLKFLTNQTICKSGIDRTTKLFATVCKIKQFKVYYTRYSLHLFCMLPNGNDTKH